MGGVCAVCGVRCEVWVMVRAGRTRAETLIKNTQQHGNEPRHKRNTHTHRHTHTHANTHTNTNLTSSPVFTSHKECPGSVTKFPPLERFSPNGNNPSWRVRLASANLDKTTYALSLLDLSSSSLFPRRNLKPRDHVPGNREDGREAGLSWVGLRGRLVMGGRWAVGGRRVMGSG